MLETPGQRDVAKEPHRDNSGHLVVDQMGKRFGAGQRAIWALRGINFTVSSGDFVVIVGESGCGKTTLLRLIAGLETPTTGSIRRAGREVTGPSHTVGFMFQQPVLLPWRTVLENVMLPLELTRTLHPRAQSQASALLRRLDLADFAGHRPRHLSGGMQQRVALARTLMLQPSMLLMDEPFGALDAITREQLNLELLRMWHDGSQTVIFITHDITEAVFLADRVLLMSQRPGTIAETFPIPLPRPRTLAQRFEPAFTSLCRDIHQAMSCMRDRAQDNGAPDANG